MVKMKNAKKLLELATQEFPVVRPGAHHSLTLDNGNLIITLVCEQEPIFQSFSMGEEDLLRDPELIIEDMKTCLRSLYGGNVS